MGPMEKDLWDRWQEEIRARINALEVGREFKIKDLFKAEWDVEIVQGHRTAFGSMFQKVLNAPEEYGAFDQIERLGVKPNQDNHEFYRRI